MNTKRIPLLKMIGALLLYISGVNLHAQLSGAVQDTNGNGIPYVNVTLYKSSDTTLVGGTITDDLGTFSMEVSEPGVLLLQLSSIGYTTYTSEGFLMDQGQVKDLGILLLKESLTDLDEVTVTARRNLIQQTEMGKVINVQRSIMTNGSSALQVLERLPGILMDKRNNSFTLNGRNGATVMFNGRRVPMSMEEVMALLESTLADTIEKIELITSPTAQYDADGGAGIINIVFKKSGYGTSRFNLSSGIGYGYGGKVNGAVQFAHGTDLLQLNASYSLSKSRGKNGFEGSGTSNMPILGGWNYTDFSTYFNYTNFNQNMTMGLLARLDTNLEVGTEFTYAHTVNSSLAHIKNERLLANGDFQLSQIITDGHTGKNNLAAAVFMTQEFTDKSKLTIDFSYLNYDNDSPATTTSTYFDRNGDVMEPNNPIFNGGNRAHSFSKIEFGVAKADVSFSVTKGIDAQMGVKGSYAANTNDSSIESKNDGIWEVDPRSQSFISSDEKLWAAYTQWKFKLTNKISFDAGFRVENWDRDLGKGFHSIHLKQVFPTLGYQHTFHEFEHLNVNYSKRISRPTYADFVTSLRYNDPTAIFTGNPLLTPSISNSIQIDYTMRGFNLGVSFQKEIDPIFRNQFTSTPENDILIVSPQNGDYQKSASLFVTLPWQWAEWAKLQVTSTSTLGDYRISFTPVPAGNTYFYQNINGSQTFSLPYQIELELSGWYNFPSYNGAHKTYGFGILNFGMSKTLNKDWGSLQFMLTDIFKSFRVRNHNGGAAPVVFDINTKSVYKDESSFGRVFRIGYSRSFGQNSTMKKRQQRKIEEIDRVN